MVEKIVSMLANIASKIRAHVNDVTVYKDERS